MPQNHPEAGVTTVDLGLLPEAEALATARKAFRQGAIVRIVGGTPEDLKRLLGVGGVSAVPSRPPAQLVYQLVAARATKRGALHEFAQLGAATGGLDSLAYQRWAEKEGRLALQEEPGVLPTEPVPPPQAWTELYKTTTSTTSPNGNVFQNTVSAYRLNDTDPAHDYYMVLTDPQSEPHFTGCPLACGWFTSQRVFTMSTTPAMVLVDHGPNNPITNDSGSFTIGGELSPSPGVDASFTHSWQQPSVVTTDQSDLGKGIGQWNEAFAGQGVFQPPPETSTGTFVSHQGSIFQVPGGTTSFQFSLDAQIISEFNHTFTDELETLPAPVTLTIFPPLFAVSVSSLTIPPGGSGKFDIVSTNPTGSTNIGLPWVVSNVPDWLTVDHVSGSVSTVVTLDVQPGTPPGSVAFVNVNTDPAFAAPSVEKTPLVVKVIVGEPDSIGTLLTGGVDTVTGAVLDTADLYSPRGPSFDFETTMTRPRVAHTATLLPSGQLLVAGGANPATASAELYDPGARTFAPTGDMTASRSGHTATLLDGGKVLLAGGLPPSGQGPSLATAELYDPGTQTFTQTASMFVPRGQHSATKLRDGTVLVVGGLSNTMPPSLVDVAEIYDPTGPGGFSETSTGLHTPRTNHTATLLKGGFSDGWVLIAGGRTPGNVNAPMELYEPRIKGFGIVNPLNVGRSGHAATLLPDGKVLITGGFDQNQNPLASAELFDPESWGITLVSGDSPCPGSPGCMTVARSGHTATLQPDGTVLLAGGVGPGNQSVGSTETYDHNTRSFSAGPSTTPRSGHAATLLQRSLAATPAVVAAAQVNRRTFLADQTLTIGATLNNPGFADSADLYLGVIFPDDDTIIFWTGGDMALGTAADLRTFRPFAADFPLETQFSVHIPNLIVYRWTGTEPRGRYVFFNLVTKAGALADGAASHDELLGLATATFLFP
jgi:hypothetical protein